MSQAKVYSVRELIGELLNYNLDSAVVLLNGNDVELELTVREAVCWKKSPDISKIKYDDLDFKQTDDNFPRHFLVLHW